jgi:Zn-dependent protease/CBS domain-containing protein
MFAARLRLFRLFGIPISIDATWLIIFALVVGSLAVGVLPHELPGVQRGEIWVIGLVTALLYFVCILLHEMGHSLVARSRGMSIRGITLFLFGGVAELADEPPSAGTEFLMAIAGPIVSAVIAIVCWVFTDVGVRAGWAPQIVVVLRWLAWINTALLGFNLIPAFPLDGGRVFRSILWGITKDLRRATYWAAFLGQAFAWILIGFALLLAFHDPRQWLNALWLGLIGMFLHNAARSTYQQVVVRELLQGEPVSHYMNTEPVVVPPSLDLQHWVDEYVYRYHRKAFPVASDGHLEGFISTRALSEIPREDWGRHTVGEVMRHDLKAVTIRPDADALAALGKMQRTGLSRLLVADQGRLVGIISLKDLMRLLQHKLALEQTGDEGSGDQF